MKKCCKKIITVGIIALLTVLVACGSDDKDATDTQKIFENIKTSMKHMEVLYNDTKGEKLNQIALKGQIFDDNPNSLQGIVNSDLSADALKIINYNNSAKRSSSEYANWYEGINLNLDSLNAYLVSEEGSVALLAYTAIMNPNETSSDKKRIFKLIGKGFKTLGKYVANPILKTAKRFMRPLAGFLGAGLSLRASADLDFSTTVNNTFNYTIDSKKITDAVVANTAKSNAILNHRFNQLTGQVGGLKEDISDLSADMNNGFNKMQSSLSSITDTTERTNNLLNQFSIYATTQFNELHNGQKNLLDAITNGNAVINEKLDTLIFNTNEILFNQKNEDFETGKNDYSNFVKQIGVLEGINDEERTALVKSFVNTQSIDIFDNSYDSAKDAFSYKKQIADENADDPDYYLFEYDLIMPSVDMLFFKEVSLMRMSFAADLYTGKDLLDFRQRHATADLEKVAEIKASVETGYDNFQKAYDSYTQGNTDDFQWDPTEFTTAEEAYEGLVNYYVAIMGQVVSWEIQLRAHILAYEDFIGNK